MLKLIKLCETGKIDGIASIRDESSKGEVRLVIEMAKGVSTGPALASCLRENDSS